MGFFSRLFGRDDHIEMQDVPAEPQEQETIEDHGDTQDAQSEQSAEPSPFFDQNSDQQ
ncbi:MAG: hypothetical protein WC819_01245 [Parcubacteria group bacterium]|jgi:hypothetical protein